MPYSKYITIVRNTFGKVAISTTIIPKGKLVRIMRGKDVSIPTKTSIQWGNEMNIKHREDKIGRFINHSCSPTLRVDGAMPYLWAEKEILPNMPLTFNYIKNENNISNSFICDDCGLTVPRDTVCEMYKT